jgi:hypothetical protein
MDSGFVDILKQLVAEQGNAALFDLRQSKALLTDYTKNEYKKETRLLLQGIEAGAAKALAETDDLEPCKKKYIRELDDDYALDTETAEDIVNTLALVLRGDTTWTISPLAERAAAEKAAADKASAEKAEAERKAAVKKALAEKDAADKAAAKQAAAAKKAAAQNAAAARKAARRSSSSGSPIFLIVDRDSGDGSEIIFGVIGAAIGLGVGSLIGGFIAIILCGAIGWCIGREIGKSVYVNLLAIILAIACGVLIAFLAGWTGNGLFPDLAPTIARILFIPFMIAGAVLFIFARSRGNIILLIALIALSIGGGIALTEPPFPFSLTKNNPAAANTATAIITAGINFRSGPSTDNAVIRQLQRGDTVTLTGKTSGGWTQVRHGNKTGWVSSEFLTQNGNWQD